MHLMRLQQCSEIRQALDETEIGRDRAFIDFV